MLSRLFVAPSISRVAPVLLTSVVVVSTFEHVKSWPADPLQEPEVPEAPEVQAVLGAREAPRPALLLPVARLDLVALVVQVGLEALVEPVAQVLPMSSLHPPSVQICPRSRERPCTAPPATMASLTTSTLTKSASFPVCTLAPMDMQRLQFLLPCRRLWHSKCPWWCK